MPNGGGGVHDAGAGSGGSILLQTTRFRGSGTLPANGGNTSGTSGGGGGGRIAVWTSVLAYPTNNAQAAGGVHSTDTNKNGQAGSIVWIRLPAVGTVVLLR